MTDVKKENSKVLNPKTAKKYLVQSIVSHMYRYPLEITTKSQGGESQWIFKRIKSVKKKKEILPLCSGGKIYYGVSYNFYISPEINEKLKEDLKLFKSIPHTSIQYVTCKDSVLFILKKQVSTLTVEDYLKTGTHKTVLKKSPLDEDVILPLTAFFRD